MNTLVKMIKENVYDLCTQGTATHKNTRNNVRSIFYIMMGSAWNSIIFGSDGLQAVCFTPLSNLQLAIY